MLVLVRCFSYTSHASFNEVFLLHLMPVLMRCFSCSPDNTSSEVSLSYTPHASFSEVFLLHTCEVKCFSNMPDASFNEVFLLHTSC